MGPDPGLAPRGSRSPRPTQPPNGCCLPIGDIALLLPQFAMSSTRASSDFWHWVTPCPSPSSGPPPGWGEGHWPLTQETWCLPRWMMHSLYSVPRFPPMWKGTSGSGMVSPGCSPVQTAPLSPVLEEAAGAACVRGASGPSSQPRGTEAMYLLVLLPLRCWTDSWLLRHAAHLAGNLLTKQRSLSGFGRVALGSQLLLVTSPMSPWGGGFWGHLQWGAELWGRCMRCWGRSGERDAPWRHPEQELRGCCIPVVWALVVPIWLGCFVSPWRQNQKPNYGAAFVTICSVKPAMQGDAGGVRCV